LLAARGYVEAFPERDDLGGLREVIGRLEVAERPFRAERVDGI
jgi:hypothetical protein